MFEAAGGSIAWTAFDVVNGDYPPASDPFDAIVISGSKASAYDKTEWILRLIGYVRDVDIRNQTTSKKVKLVGICFGHQIMAEALGGQVTKNANGWEVGWTQLQLTDDGMRFFSLSDKQLCIQEMHQDHVSVVPKGFTVLASSSVSRVQIMIKSNECIAIQGHPEYHAGIVREFIRMRAEKNIFSSDQAAQWLSVVDNQSDGITIAKRLIQFIES